MTTEVERSSISFHPISEPTFADRIAHLLTKTCYRRADSDQQRRAIGRLRYQAYLREAVIAADPAETFSDPYDETENAYLFGLYVEDELASSLRLHIGSSEHPYFPSLEVFADALQPLLDAGAVVVDATRFVADERLSRLHRGLPYITLRLCMLAAEHFGAAHLLAAVRAEHQAFYRRAFNHRLLCEPRPYPQLAKPISLMTLHFPSAAADLYRRYPFFHSTPLEREKLFERQPEASPCRQPADPKKPSAQRRCRGPFAELEAAHAGR
jgi:N-acyl-L-homoserine lactone synthetase